MRFIFVLQYDRITDSKDIYVPWLLIQSVSMARKEPLGCIGRLKMKVELSYNASFIIGIDKTKNLAMIRARTQKAVARHYRLSGGQTVGFGAFRRLGFCFAPVFCEMYKVLLACPPHIRR